MQEWSRQWTRRVYGVTVFTLLFLIPATFVVGAFVFIVRELWLGGVAGFHGPTRSLRPPAPSGLVSRTAACVCGHSFHGPARSESGVVRSRRAANVLAGRRRIARLLAAIAVAFAVCWMPYHLLRSAPPRSSQT